MGRDEGRYFIAKSLIREAPLFRLNDSAMRK